MTERTAGELPGCAPRASKSKATSFFLKPDALEGDQAIDLCMREAAVFAGLAGRHNMPEGAMCICNPVRQSDV